MAKEFRVKVLTPGRELFRGEATEVLLPAYDGETGILAGHCDFIGLLGTGALKVVANGNDFWFMLSGGAYRVVRGELAILAEQGETPADSDLNAASEQAKEVERKLFDIKNFSNESFTVWKRQLDQAKARIEIHRRTEVVN